MTRWLFMLLILPALAMGCESAESRGPETRDGSVGGAGNEPAMLDASTPVPELSCPSQFAAVGTTVSNAIVAHRVGCQADEDCVVVLANTSCMERCPTAVTVESEALFEASIVDACAGVSGSCPEYQGPRACTPVRAHCAAETCLVECDQPGWPDRDVPGQFVREGGYCGDEQCPAFPEVTDPRRHYAQSCCTTDGACGVFAEALGPDCFARQDPAPPSEQCPGELLFLYVDLGSYAGVVDDLRGCCRPDGTCGLDTSETWGAGCVARADIAHAAAATCTAENQELALLESISCDPGVAP